MDGLLGSVGCESNWCSPTDVQEVAGLTPLGWHHSFVEIDHEIFSTIILSLPLIQEGQLSISGERMCTILVATRGVSLIHCSLETSKSINGQAVQTQIIRCRMRLLIRVSTVCR